MIRCRVLLFAHLAEIAQARRIDVELPDDACVGDALARVIAAHPAMAPLRDRIAIAADDAYVRADAPLRADQTIALIPPVSGG